jgi:hypothetical protein|tara:strand:+ start:73 stop:198 length:126 start_codon:yes stop_codon:yes gene_type:complete
MTLKKPLAKDPLKTLQMKPTLGLKNKEKYLKDLKMKRFKKK